MGQVQPPLALVGKTWKPHTAPKMIDDKIAGWVSLLIICFMRISLAHGNTRAHANVAGQEKSPLLEGRSGDSGFVELRAETGQIISGF
jgi:hypothetical protein